MNGETKNTDEKHSAGSDDDRQAVQIGPVEGKFRKIRMDPITVSGRYRGRGSLQLTPEGLQINGRHVFSLGARWAIGLGIFFGSLILSIAVTGGAGYCAPGFIPIYFLVEYFILKREDILVPYPDITQLAVASQSSLVGIDFKGNPQTSPVFMETPAWNNLLTAIQLKVPTVAVSKSQAKRKPRWPLVVLIILFAIIIIGIIASLAIPNLLVAKQRAMQKEAMLDIQNISTALLDYILDHPEPPIREWTLDMDGELYQALVPDYSNAIPGKDPWGNAYRLYFGGSIEGNYGLSESDIGENDILVVSTGRDGLPDSWFYDAYDPEAGLFSGSSMDDFDNDLVTLNGTWIRRPR